MKVTRRTQAQGFEGENISDLVEHFNRIMDWISRSPATYKEHTLDVDKLRGYVLYEEVFKTPETMRDQLDLMDMKVTCGQCNEFTKTRGSYGTCPHCRGELRSNDECCEELFEHWVDDDCWLYEEERRRYREAENQFRCASIRRGEGSNLQGSGR